MIMYKRFFTAAAVIIAAAMMVMISARELPQIVKHDNNAKTTIHLSR